MTGWRLNRVILALNRGAVIAYPTDTIWGLGCDPLDVVAVRRIQHIKQRPSAKGLILLGSSAEQFAPFIDRTRIDALLSMPSDRSGRPVTWVVDAARHCPGWLTGNNNTIAIRLTDKPLISELCGQLRRPLISTSANFSGRPSARNSLQVHRDFRKLVDFIVEDHRDHSSLGGQALASRIIDLRTGRILRP